MRKRELMKERLEEEKGRGKIELLLMEKCILKVVNNCFNTNICSYLETSGDQSSNLYLNVVHFFNTGLN